MKNKITFLTGFFFALFIGFYFYYYMIYFLYGSKEILVYSIFSLMTSKVINALLLSVSVVISYLPLISIKESAIQKKLYLTYLFFYLILFFMLTISHFMIRIFYHSNYNIVQGYDFIIACNIIFSSIINFFLMRKVINVFFKTGN
jgi:hypothetical protein